mgnify:CR=1 FL=1
MKILKLPNTNWAFETGCRCGTRVELELSDFKKYEPDQRDGDAVVWQCPTCKYDNWLSVSLIPNNLHHLLPR